MLSYPSGSFVRSYLQQELAFPSFKPLVGERKLTADANADDAIVLLKAGPP